MRLTKQDMKNRRENMIQMAFCLFCDKGIENVSMSEIAKKANVGENTLYRYFSNKGKLVQETFVKFWDTIMQNVERIVENAPDYDSMTGYEQIKVWIEGFRCLYESDKDFVLFSYEAKLFLLHQNIKLDQYQQDMLMQPFRGSCIAALDKGKSDGSILVQENSEDLFYAIWGSIRGYIVKIVIYGELFGEDSPWERRYNIMERGIMSALRSGWNPA